MHCVDDFNESREVIVGAMDLEDVVATDKVIRIVSRISERHPFVFLPDLVEDVVEGEASSVIMSRYCIHSYPAFWSLVQSTLGFVGSRARGHGKDSRTKNLSRPAWHKEYDLLSSRCSMLRGQLVPLHCCNLLTAMVVHSVLQRQYIPHGDLEEVVRRSYETIRSHTHTPRCKRSGPDPLSEYMEEGLGVKIDRIVADLAGRSYLTRINGDVSIPEKYSRMEDAAYEILSGMADGASHYRFMTQMLREMPLLRLVPDTDAPDRCLRGLEARGLVVQKGRGSGHNTGALQLFTSSAYERIINNARAQAAAAGRVKFFGRNVEPDMFVRELRGLEHGDLDDRDDQVTRIAGLVLSDAAVPQNPPESIGGFDFTVDLSGYVIRPEQADLMKRLDFVLSASVVHCKVMVGRAVTAKMLSRLRTAVPDGEQGVVFTCEDVPETVAASARADRKVQVIGEEGLVAWCRLTPVMPCRKNSVACVMYGDARGKAVQVRHLNYESGLATVAAAPDMAESTLPIRCLREMGPDMPGGEGDFDGVSEDYFGLVCEVARMSPDAFTAGVEYGTPQMYDSCGALLKAIQAEADRRTGLPQDDLDGVHGGGIGGEQAEARGPTEPRFPPAYGARYALFDDGTRATVTTKVARIPVCTCYHWINCEYSTTLCKHLVAAVLAAVAASDDPASAIACARECLARLRERDVEKCASAVHYALGDAHGHLLVEYLKALASA